MTRNLRSVSLIMSPVARIVRQDVKAVPEFVYGIREATLPHLFDLGNRSPAGGNDAFDLGVDLVDFILSHIRD